MTRQTYIDAPEGQRFLTITRTFDAPAELVARAHLDPNLMPQWMVGPGYETVITDFEARHGGKWGFLHKDAEGNEWEFRGVFHGDPSVDGIIRTFAFELFPMDVCLEHLTFTEENGETTLHAVSVFLTQESRDGMAESMESGVLEGFERLDEMLARLNG